MTSLQMNPDKPSFPWWSSCAVLSTVALLMGVVAWLIVPAVFGQSSTCRQAILVAATVVWGSALLGLLPVSIACRWGVIPTAYGYFIGAGTRVVICLVTTVVALRLGWPAGPWATTLLGIYLPLLFVEVGLVGRFLWCQDWSTMGPGQGLDDADDSHRDATYVCTEALT